MSAAVDDIVNKIVANGIGREAAVRSFERLSAAERNQVLSRLRSRLAGAAGTAAAVPTVTLLRPVDERSLDKRHKDFLVELGDNYGKFAPTSKENALKYQRCFVDARKAANLKRALKSLQFHITYDRADGPYLHDVDGNEYIDITGDNGVNIFGSQPAFIREAITGRVNRGYPLVGYTEELFAAAKLFCDITGNERVAFTQSGTEAVMWAVRIARAATQKTKIVIFDGAYHGLSDTVGAVKGHAGSSFAAGLGIPQEYAEQLIVLDYGDMDQLSVIEARADEIAGVLVEPVQASRPQLQPVEYLRELRKLTLEKDIPLIFDEMITGFRVCPRGAQGAFRIKADIATYGKIPGGGMPTGMVAGTARYMDFVDGGSWGYEDDSMPGLKRIYLGGTHTRNPIKISAVHAVLKEIEKGCRGGSSCESCTCFQKELNDRTRDMAERLNALFLRKRIPAVVDYFSSLFKFRFVDDPRGLTKELFLVLLRMNGVETSVSGNFFITVAHSDEHIGKIVDAVERSIDTLIEQRFFYEPTAEEAMLAATPTTPSRAALGNEQERMEGERIPRLERIKRLVASDLQGFLEGEVV